MALSTEIGPENHFNLIDCKQESVNNDKRWKETRRGTQNNKDDQKMAKTHTHEFK